MIQNFDDILLELSYRVGIVDLTKEHQVTELINILKENGYDNAFELGQKARVYFSYLNEAKQDIKQVLAKTFTNPDTGNDVMVGTALGYDKKSRAYGIAKGMFNTAGYSEKDIDMVDVGPGDEEKPKKSKSTKTGTKQTSAPKVDIDVTDAEKNKQQKTKEVDYKATEGQIKIFKGQKKVLLDVIEKGFLSSVEKITKGVGAFDPDEKQLKALVDVTKKQIVNPNYQIKLPKYKIEDEDIDIAVGLVKNRLKENYKKWEQQIMKAGAVDPFLTTGENGKKRFREIVKKYLETGGRSAITGEFVPFNRMQLDHRVPYSSAAQSVADKKKNGIKTTLEAEKAKLDSSPNWDLMETSLNQFKNSLVGNDLIEKAAKRLNMSPDEKELKKIQQELQTIQREQLFTNLVKSFGKNDYSGFNENSIMELNGNDAGMLAKAWNYWHPNPKTPEFRDNIKNDSNYISNLKNAGIDPEKVHPNFIYRYQAQVGGSRTRGIVKPPGELKASIFTAMKKEGVISSKKEVSQTDTALARAILSIQKSSKELSSREKELKQKIKQSSRK
jgi:hypothetical protein